MIEEIRVRVKTAIVNALELEVTIDDIADNALLFAPVEKGGLDLDSLSALEIIVAIAQEFKILIADVSPEVFISIDTLSKYVSDQLSTAQEQ